MTREDAISILNVIVHMLEPKYDTDRVEDAVDMAIKSLEQEPKTEWIPIKEKQPQNHDWYLIVVKEKSTGYQYIPRVATYLHDNCWCIIDTEDADEDWLNDLECIAWMPLPKPYKAESEDKE